MTMRLLAVLMALLIGLGPALPALAQSGGNCSIFRSWSTGDSVTAADLNSSFTTVGVTNFVTSCVDGLSDSVSGMQSTATPYSSGTESQATSLAGELQRLRYVLQTITGWPNWYRVDLPVSLGMGSHVTTSALHIGVRGSLQFPALTLGQDHTTGLFSPAAHHVALGFDATSNQGRFGIGQTNARSWVSFHATAITMHHTLALRFTHSQSQMGNGQYGHVTALRLTSGSTTNPNSFGFFEGNDQLVLGHATSALHVESPTIFDRAVTFTGAVTGAGGGGTWSSRGQFSGTGFTANGGHVFTLRAHAVTLFNPTTHAITVARVNPADISVDISDITGGTGGGATPNGADRKATFDVSSWIHFYWIWHGTSSLLRGLASEQPPSVGPNLPAGYASWAYAGAVRRGTVTASPLVSTHIVGSLSLYAQGASVSALASGSDTGDTLVDLSALVPPTALSAYLHISARTAGNQNAIFGYKLQSGVADSLTLSCSSGAGTSCFNTMTWWAPNLSQRIFYTDKNGSVGQTDIDVLGFKNPNGGE